MATNICTLSTTLNLVNVVLVLALVQAFKFLKLKG